MTTTQTETNVLRAVPLSAENFRAFGDVIEKAPGTRIGMNNDRFERFKDLARVDVGAEGGRTCVSISRSSVATQLPYRFELVERHPLGSQAFMPLGEFRFIVVVAPPGEAVAPSDLRAFITNGQQGVNYRPGVWHMPLIALEAGQTFFVVDRRGAGTNLEERLLGSTVTLVAD
jgi:ureidoglycolate lyase